jgi:predicted aspartyl protease
METEAMGKVIVTAKIENLEDLFNLQKGLLSPEQVRSVEVTDALVDTAATGLSLPKWLVSQLGLYPFRSQRARTSAGLVTFQVYGSVRLTVQGRVCTCDVVEIPDECPVLIGQIPLEGLDLVVDPAGRRLIGNPEHGGEHMIEMY